MAFKSEDIYTASGNTKLFNAWTPYVSKFDTSSFYNWEQDNLPLYDLEERTYELWEQQGWPTSSIPGLALTVSADADSATLLSESTLFTDVSSAIAAIPKIVRFPVLIEVGSFGDLGKLELHNFRFEENGSIEIINRNFGRFLCASSIVTEIDTPDNNQSQALVTQVSSLDLSNTLSDSSCVHLAIPVFSATMDSRFGGSNSTMFAHLNHNERKSTLSVTHKNLTVTDGPNLFGIDSTTTHVYEDTAATHSDLSIPTEDLSAVSDFLDSIITRVLTTSGQEVKGAIYNNYCSKISIKNCEGPIYIRNFFVDPANSVENGIEVNNSEVVLENCASIRSKNAGFKFSNSKVILSRSAFSYRNYELDGGLGVTARIPNKGAGFLCLNSEVTLSSLPATLGSSDGAKDYGASAKDAVFIAARNTYGFVLQNSILNGGLSRSDLTNPETASLLSVECNKQDGFLLTNSIVNVKGLIDVYNNDVGINSNNSTIVTEELCVDRQNSEGYLATGSRFTFDSSGFFTEAGQAVRSQVDFTQNKQHVVLKSGSIFEFKEKNHMPTLYGSMKFMVSHGAEVFGVGGKCYLPSISVESGSKLSLIHPFIDISEDGPNSTVDFGKALRVINGSVASLYGTKTGCNAIVGPDAYGKQILSAGAYVANGSTLNLHGPTLIAKFGVDVLVEDHSTLNIQPSRNRTNNGLNASSFDLEDTANHTSVELHSVKACLVANNNSTINLQDLGDFRPNWDRTTNGSNKLSNGYDYVVATITPSALVANGSLQFFPNPNDSTTVNSLNLHKPTNLTGLGSTSFPKFTSGTYMNTFLVNDTPVLGTNNETLRGQVSLGGMCVRALGNSVVNAMNVHFPTGNDGGELDGLLYNASGSNCDRLMIWNIADTSKLNASYLSVSGLYPLDAQYYGPSAVYVSSDSYGTNATSFDFASGAPTGTPDTGSLSILDSFGYSPGNGWSLPIGASINSSFTRFFPMDLTGLDKTDLSGAEIILESNETSLQYGASAAANTGPFRLYFSVSPAAKVLATDVSGYAYGVFNGYGAGQPYDGEVGAAYQIFSQGYNLSAPVSALNLEGGNSASSVYPQLLKMSKDTDADNLPDSLVTSGFYYCSEFVESNPTQCMLDESAAATFANAKNASLGTSGRPKKVTVYRAGSDSATNRESEAYQGDSIVGFKSSNVFDLRRDC